MSRITKTKCPQDLRMDFLPNAVGEQSLRYLRYEQLTYAFMDKACSNYGGGFWNFYSLSNGGFYIAPDTDHSLKLVWEDNYFEGEMSADAAGICASLMAQNAFAWEEQDERFTDKFHALREYALEHKEAALILGFID